MSFDPKEVGRRIAAARDRKGWTQVVFASHAHISPSTVSRWERGLLPPVRELIRIAAVLEVDVADLVEDPEPSKTPGEILILAELEKLKILLREVLENQDAEDDPPLDQARQRRITNPGLLS